MQSFDWSLVRSFLAVLDAGSLLGAAKKLGAQQPTLSRHVAELEAQIGQPLFERTGRGVVPTAAALAIVDSAREMEMAAVRVTQKLTQREQANQGTVRVAASQVAAAYLLPPVIAALHREEPSIAIEIVASNEVANLLRREADIAVRMVRPVQASLIARKLGEVEVVACASKTYLREHGIPKRPEDLVRHRLVGYDRDQTIERGFARFGSNVPREAFVARTDDHITYGRLVATGVGVGFMARYNLREFPHLRAVLPMLQIPPLPCWLAVHREIRGNRIVRRVYDFLATAIPEQLR
jgi:DNA-binding transcriptional LysR family regulator